MVRAKRGHPFPCPPIPASGRQTVGTQRAGRCVRRNRYVRAHERPQSGSAFGVWALSVHDVVGDSQFGMDTALPMNEQVNFAGVRIHVDNELHE